MSAGVLRALGLCKRAGALICGTPMVCDSLRDAKKKPIIVVMASDVSPATRKKLTDKCTFYETCLVAVEADGEALAAAVGKSGFLAAAAVTDPNLAELVKKALAQN